MFYAVCVAAAFAASARLLWFGLLFFAVTLLPVVFVPARQGYVLYLPAAGLALYVATLLVWFRTKLNAYMPSLRRYDPYGPAALFLLTAILLGAVHLSHFPRAPRAEDSRQKVTVEQMSRILPSVHAGMKLLFVKDLFENSGYDLVFTLSMFYREQRLFVTQLDGPPEQRVPVERLGRYDHIFTYEDGYYVELDNTDTQRSVRLQLIKPGQILKPLGEKVAIGSLGQTQYFVKDILYGPHENKQCWTGEALSENNRATASGHACLRARFGYGFRREGAFGKVISRHFC